MGSACTTVQSCLRLGRGLGPGLYVSSWLGKSALAQVHCLQHVPFQSKVGMHDAFLGLCAVISVAGRWYRKSASEEGELVQVQCLSTMGSFQNLMSGCNCTKLSASMTGKGRA